jgi:hypothetical protein
MRTPNATTAGRSENATRRRKPLDSEAKLIEDAESIALFESAIRAIKERYAGAGPAYFRNFLETVAEARRQPKNRCAGDSRPLVRVQACRPADRAMLETSAGAELVTAAVTVLKQEDLDLAHPPTAAERTIEELRAAGLWPFPKQTEDQR